MHRLVAAAALVSHMLFVAFTVVGGFLAWLFPWLLLPHLGSTLWGARMAIRRRTCPLSWLENWGRSGAGRPRLHQRGFIAHYFEGRLYPTGWTRQVEVVVGTLILGSWLGFAIHN